MNRTFKWARHEPLPDLVDIKPKKIPIDLKLNEDIPITLELTNISSSLVAFKIKTTAPERYLVRPTQGYLTLQETKKCVIILSKMREFPSSENPKNLRDKFLIQTVPIREPPSDLSEMWKEVESEHHPKNKMYAFHGQQIKCKLIIPAIGGRKASTDQGKPSNAEKASHLDPAAEESSEGKLGPKTINGTPSSSPPSKSKSMAEENTEIDETVSSRRTGHQMTINEHEYQELLADREKYEKVLSEVSSLTLENQKLEANLQHWKDRVLQEQLKRETIERELQELRTRSSDQGASSQRSRGSETTNPQDSKSIPDTGLHRRQSSLGLTRKDDQHPLTTESKLSDKDQDKSDNLTSSIPSASDTKESRNKISLLSRDLKRPQSSDNTPLVVKGWFQIILFALVFFVLGRLLRS